MIREIVITREKAEDRAYAVLASYYGAKMSSLEPPIDVEMIGEAHFDLKWEWDVIDDSILPKSFSSAPLGSMVILAGLYPRSKRVVLNEKHVALFQEKPGLERFTKGHEIGHWVLHIDQGVLNNLPLFDYDGNEGSKPEAIICRDGDDTWIERQANWFAAGLLMPKDLFLRKASPLDLQRWQSRYELAERFGVTISAVGVRLGQSGLSYVDEKGDIHRSKAERSGQMALRG